MGLGTRASLAVGLFVAIGALGAPQAAAPQQPSSARAVARPAPDYRPVLNQYCVTCHSERLKTAGLVLENLDLTQVPQHADLWEKVVRKLRGGMMPPQGSPRPDAATTDSLASWLETTLDRAAAARPDPGRPLLHRMNRLEYANAIHDLLDLDVDVASLLPPDDSSYGFDNVAGVLGYPPCCSSGTWPPRCGSAPSPSGTCPLPPRRKPTVHAPIRPSRATSTGCRSARAAAR
jgi:mono/diheme cytochrome c family protein